MKRTISYLGVLWLCLAISGLAKEKKPKPGPLTGTWECVSHGGPEGDLPFTLHLQQSKDIVTGAVDSPLGGTQISSGTYKKKTVEIQINSPQATYRLTGRLRQDRISGEWFVLESNQKGSWQGKKSIAPVH